MNDANFSLQDKVILVTGAASGIGRASALIFARAGAKVVAVGKSTDPLVILVNEIKASGGDALAVTADISVEAEVVAMVKSGVERFGRLDNAFNNAGVEMNNKTILDLSADQWDHVFNVDVAACFYV